MTAWRLEPRLRASARLRSLVLVSLFGAIGCTSPAADPERPPRESRDKLRFVPLETRARSDDAQTIGHAELTGLLFLPEDRGLLVWEKTGRVSHYRLVADVLERVGESQLEAFSSETDCGLISIALDPDWVDNHLLYAAHCTRRTHGAVTRFRFDGTNHERLATTGVRIIELGDEAAKKDHHNVGAIGFFPDRLRSMWILVGDKKIPANAQDSSKNLGGVLRIVPNRGSEGGYEPHPDNPFGGPGADPERQSSPDLYAWGLRSPWRGGIDERGRLWIGEVGADIEEINLARAAGHNFGWGRTDGPCKRAAGVECDGLTDPVAWWGRGSNHQYRLDDEAAGPTVRRVAWLGAAYRASSIDPYEGLLDDAIVFGDMCVGFVRALAVDARGERIRDEPIGHLVGLSGAAQGPDGHLYVTSYGGCTSDTLGKGGGIYRAELNEAAAAEPRTQSGPRRPLVDEPLGPMPDLLSETGIFSDSKRSNPIGRAIRYEPSLPLWSNGSDKERWLLLPDGARVDNAERGHWKFPVGSLFFKTFGFQDTNVETRILRRTRSGWDYHAYAWRGSDAELLSLERSVARRIELANEEPFSHEVPSRFDCRSCHESNETIVIGFDELRLNHRIAGGSSTQLEALAAQGVFRHPLPTQPAGLAHEDALTREVLGYLHGNCAHCHNASENTMSLLDLAHDRALANLVGVDTESSGQATGVRVMPGSPEQSVLFLAMSGEDGDMELQAMPPIGVQRRDAMAIEMVRTWIRGLRDPR